MIQRAIQQRAFPLHRMCLVNGRPRAPVCISCSTRVRLHDAPVNTLPPRLQIVPLPRNAPIPQPGMLPRGDTQEQIQVRAARRQRRASAESPHRAGTHARRPAAVAVGDDAVVGRGDVDRLFAPVRAGEGRAGEVGVQDGHFLRRVLFHEPGEAGPEHGGGGGEEGLAQRLERGEGDVDVREEGLGADLGRVLGCWCLCGRGGDQSVCLCPCPLTAENRKIVDVREC